MFFTHSLFLQEKEILKKQHCIQILQFDSSIIGTPYDGHLENIKLIFTKIIKNNLGYLSGLDDSILSSASLFGDDVTSFNRFMDDHVRQYMLEEEVRTRHQAAMLKLREKALKVAITYLVSSNMIKKTIWRKLTSNLKCLSRPSMLYVS